VSAETSPKQEITVTEKQFTPIKTPSKEEILLHRIAYELSYNTETRQPYWVAWRLTSEHTDGPFSRKGVPYYDDSGKAIGISSFSDDIMRGDYFIDMDVPSPRQEHNDWKDHPASIDHGHMCPAADCKWDKGAMNQSFLLTNMCPQDHDLNGGDWDKLENKCRTWAKRYGEILIVAGPIFENDERHCFGINKIPIPDAFFKVVLCTTGNPKSLGFIFPNNGKKHNLEKYVMSVDEVENTTGIDFFPALQDSIEDVVEAHANLDDWR
jgi:endonuclease G